VTPVSVLVQGRPTLLSQLDRVQTEPIDITGLTEPYRQQVALSLPEGITQDEVEEIFVEIDIEPLFTTDTYNPKVFIQGLDEDLEAAVDPDTVRVVLSGPLPALETLLDEEVSVTIDLFGLVTGTYSLEPTVSFPDRGIELRSIQPSQVTVEITRPLTITNELTGTLPITGTTASTITRPDTVDNDHNATYSLTTWPSQTAVLPNPHSFPKRVKS
jgi:YbbR domain-containing protein